MDPFEIKIRVRQHKPVNVYGAEIKKKNGKIIVGSLSNQLKTAQLSCRLHSLRIMESMVQSIFSTLEKQLILAEKFQKVS